MASVESDGGRVVAKHSLVVVHPSTSDSDHDTLLCYDCDAAALLVPARYVRCHDDPRSQPWCHPVPLTSHQAALLLRSSNQPGCFLVYRLGDGDDSRYQLAVCLDHDVVVHYDIRRLSLGDFAVDGDCRRFLSVSDLVTYYQRNVGLLAARLRRALRHAACPPTAGYQFPVDVELDRSRLHITDSILVGGGADCGEVWAGTYDGRPVAVKVLQYPSASKARRVRLDDEFISETNAMIGLRHENVVRLVGVCSASLPRLIVTDDSFSGTLKDVLRASRIPCERAGCSRRAQLIDIGLQVTAAVAYLASRRYILHRRLSASSFVVSADSRPRVKMTDFSRARRVSADDSYTADGCELVSVKWAAPEVLSQLHYSSRSDVWAAGVVLWQASPSLFLSAKSSEPEVGAKLVMSD